MPLLEELQSYFLKTTYLILQQIKRLVHFKIDHWHVLKNKNIFFVQVCFEKTQYMLGRHTLITSPAGPKIKTMKNKR